MYVKLFSLLLVGIIHAEVNNWNLPVDEHVPYLTSSNFNSFLNDHPIVFVKFYAPWCGHCKKMTPEYQRLVLRTSSQKNGIPVVKVDATKEQDLATKYGIKGYPMLKLFKNGEIIDYKGPRVETYMYNFIMRESGDLVKQINSREELQEFQKNTLAVLYVLSEHNQTALDELTEMAKNMPDMLFAYSVNSEHLNILGLKGKYNVVIVRSFDDGNKSFESSEPFTPEEIKGFIETHKNPLLVEFDEKIAQKILGERKPAMILFTDDFDAPVVEDFRYVAMNFKGSMYFGISKISSKFGPRLAAMADVARGPAIRIIQAFPQGITKFIIENISKQGIISGLENFRAGKLPPSYKSELVPPAQTGAVKNIIGNNFFGEVINNEKFVLVEGYAPWCGHCKNLEPIYEELAQKLSNHNDITIAKMDATKNEFPLFKVVGYPTLALYKPGQKNSPVYYQGERTLDLLLSFMEEHVGRNLSNTEQVSNTEL